MGWRPSQVGAGPRVYTAREPLGVPGSSGTLPHHAAALTVSPTGPHHPPCPGASRPILLHAYDSQPPPGQVERPPTLYTPTAARPSASRPSPGAESPPPSSSWALGHLPLRPQGNLLSPPSTCGTPARHRPLPRGLKPHCFPGQSAPSSPPTPPWFPQEQQPPLTPHGAHSDLRWLQQQNPWTVRVAGKAQRSGCLRGLSGATTRVASEAPRGLLADLKYPRWGQGQEAEPADQWPQRQRLCQATSGSVPTWTPSHLFQRTLVPVPSGSRPRVMSDSESRITVATTYRPGFRTSPWGGCDAPRISPNPSSALIHPWASLTPLELLLPGYPSMLPHLFIQQTISELRLHSGSPVPSPGSSS